MKEVPFSRRRTLAALSNAIDVPRSTLHDYMRQGGMWKLETNVVLVPLDIRQQRRTSKQGSIIVHHLWTPHANCLC